MFRRTLPEGLSRRLLDRLSNRLIKITAAVRKLNKSWEQAESGQRSPRHGIFNWKTFRLRIGRRSGCGITVPINITLISNVLANFA